MVAEGKLHCLVEKKQFLGIEAVKDAVEYMYSGKSSGKVIVQINPEDVSKFLLMPLW